MRGRDGTTTQERSIEEPIIFFCFKLYILEGASGGLLDTWMGVSQGRSHRYQKPQTLQNVCIMSHERIEPNTGIMAKSLAGDNCDDVVLSI